MGDVMLRIFDEMTSNNIDVRSFTFQSIKSVQTEENNN
jgi:hypothetical protein